MKSFAERNPLIIGAVGCALAAGAVVGVLTYQDWPIINTDTSYTAYFAEAGGLLNGAPVQVSGLDVGRVTGIDLDGNRVIVTFDMNNNIRLGDRTEAAIKTKSLLGAKTLEIAPRGQGALTGTIPIDRTRSPYQLPDALGDLANTINGLDTDEVSQSLSVLSQTFANTAPDLKLAVDGVGRISETLNQRDEHLRNLLANANKVTGVLAQRSDQVVSLIADTSTLLVELQNQANALDHISSSIVALSQQLKGFIAENRGQFKGAVDKLNGVLAIVDNHKQKVQEAIKGLNIYGMGLGEAVASGPFFKAYLANVIPGQFSQPFIDAAFSDLGLDPNVLAPSDRTDPQLGQPATPALPLPYPRTGQGGEPHLNLPGAITGNPGDPRYPYRPPLPAPPPGGPPPGPPALSPPGMASSPEPTPSPVFEPAPGEPGYSPAPTGAPPLPGQAGQ